MNIDQALDLAILYGQVSGILLVVLAHYLSKKHSALSFPWAVACILGGVLFAYIF